MQLPKSEDLTYKPAQYHQPQAASELSQQGSKPTAVRNVTNDSMGQPNGMAAHFANLAYHSLATEPQLTRATPSGPGRPRHSAAPPSAVPIAGR
jgi:hypothetical protein